MVRTADFLRSGCGMRQHADIMIVVSVLKRARQPSPKPRLAKISTLLGHGRVRGGLDAPESSLPLLERWNLTLLIHLQFLLVTRRKRKQRLV